MKPIFAAAFAATTLVATAALAEPVTYDFDPSHSQVVFDYKHLGFSDSTGIINRHSPSGPPLDFKIA